MNDKEQATILQAIHALEIGTREEELAAINALRSLLAQPPDLVAGAERGETEALHGFSREDLQSIADSLTEGYEKTVNVGNVTGEGDEHIESTTAAAARFIRAAMQASTGAGPEPQDDAAKAQAENGAFCEWWDSSGQGSEPLHTLVVKNAAHAAWQERALRASAADTDRQGSNGPEPCNEMTADRWLCSRKKGHDGPCDAHATDEVDFSIYKGRPVESLPLPPSLPDDTALLDARRNLHGLADWLFAMVDSSRAYIHRDNRDAILTWGRAVRIIETEGKTP